MIVDALIWEMKNGEVTVLLYDDREYLLKEIKPIGSEEPTKKKNELKVGVEGKRYPNYLDKVIFEHQLKRFTLKQLLDLLPYKKRYEHHRIKKYLMRMIEDNTVKQVDNDTFIVCRYIVEKHLEKVKEEETLMNYVKGGKENKN